MKTIDPFDDFWNKITEYKAKHIEENFPTHAAKLLQLLLAKGIAEERFDIGIMYIGSTKWSHITFKELDTEKEVSLRYTETGFDLYFNYYSNDVGDYVQISHTIIENVLAIIPNGLQVLMIKSLKDGGMLVTPNMIDL